LRFRNHPTSTSPRIQPTKLSRLPATTFEISPPGCGVYLVKGHHLLRSDYLSPLHFSHVNHAHLVSLCVKRGREIKRPLPLPATTFFHNYILPDGVPSQTSHRRWKPSSKRGEDHPYCSRLFIHLGRRPTILAADCGHSDARGSELLFRF
jgi:hypothetical protein